MPKALLIAVVEDDWFFRDSMRSLMKSLGYTVEAFSSAADFLASPHLIETACLIADVHMPAMSGLELYRYSSMRDSRFRQSSSLPTRTTLIEHAP
jgi:FixJ family two-component response regulator